MVSVFEVCVCVCHIVTLFGSQTLVSNLPQVTYVFLEHSSTHMQAVYVYYINKHNCQCSFEESTMINFRIFLHFTIVVRLNNPVSVAPRCY